ncbi:MAG: bifunctional methylenetetrahydrofolate dehydrogenase/methenyltetrahydrofolate cyclohydrolase FolD [Candidatus Gastranaerophilales bacterium]|nr:bifunctional methylenetetrahydrofolate dehydrogenase/methenyltetrahydrofolate cyclohydrolase FolD [Candidatus Gastranaerophilales bacterium]
MTTIIDGKNLSEKILKNLKEEIIENNYTPSLAVVIVENNPASQIYVRNKNKKALELGIKSQIVELDENISQNDLEKEVERLAKDNGINAILVQLPLPKHIDAQRIIEKIPPNKDVDGFHPYNAGKLLSNQNPFAKPCTPLGIIKILDEYNITIEGKNVVVVGRSNIVGKPLAVMLTNLNATVTLCHSKTQNLKEICKSADILIGAIGKPKFFTHEFVKNNAVVIDVGISRDENGKLSGDFDFEDVKDLTSFITPVPKGVGPMTIAMLMSNTLELYKIQKTYSN